MRATGSFTVASFVPTDVAPAPAVMTALPVGVALMEKRFEGEISGRSATIFTSAFDQEKGLGTYVAMESFEGTLNDRRGTFNFVHAASTSGGTREDAFLFIVAGSGTDELSGVSGRGELVIEADGTHRITFDYTLP